jgi:hypothetical protein
MFRNANQKIQYPHKGNGTDTGFSPLELATKLAPYVGDMPIPSNDFIANTTAPYVFNFRCRHMVKRIDDIFQDSNKTSWFHVYFPRATDGYRHKLEMVTKMEMNIMQPKLIQAGAPNAFTTFKRRHWFNQTVRKGLGFEAPWDFMDDQTGQDMFVYFVAGMAASMEYQVKIDTYTRLNELPDQYCAWVFKKNSNNQSQSLSEVLAERKKEFNIVHETPFACWAQLEMYANDRQTRARLTPTDGWIVDQETNNAMILDRSNSTNSSVGQYKIDGDGALNKINGCKDISTIAGKPVALQQFIQLADDQLYHPLRAWMIVGHYYVIPNASMENCEKYTSDYRSIKIHDTKTDSLKQITYQKAVYHAMKLLVNVSGGFKKMFPHSPYLYGHKCLWPNVKEIYQNNRERTARKAQRELCLKKFQVSLGKKEKLNPTFEASKGIYQDLNYTSMSYTTNWLNEVVSKNAAYFSGEAKLSSSEKGKNFIKLPKLNDGDGNPKGLTYLIARSLFQEHGDEQGKIVPELFAHVKYLNNLIKHATPYIKWEGMPSKIKFENGDVEISVGDGKDVGFWLDLLLNANTAGFVAVAREWATLTLTGPNYNWVEVPNKDKKYTPTLIPWMDGLESVKAGSTSVFKRVVLNMPNLKYPCPAYLAEFSDRRSYLRYIEPLFAHLDIGTEDENKNESELKCVRLIDENCEPGFGVQLSTPNECYHVSNGYRIKIGGLLQYVLQSQESLVRINDKIRRLEVDFEAESGVALLDPDAFNRFYGIVVHGVEYGATVSDGMLDHTFWDQIDQLSNRYRKKTISEYKQEPSIYAFFIDPLYDGTDDQVMTNSQLLKQNHVPEPEAIYSPYFNDFFDVTSWQNQELYYRPEGEMEDEMVSRGMVMSRGICQIPSPDDGKFTLYNGNGWFHSLHPNGTNKFRFGQKKTDKK